MMDATLHPMPRMRDVVLEQIRIVGLALRPIAMIAGVVIGIITVLVTVAIVRGNASSWFDSSEWFPIALMAFLFPFAVWRKDRRFGPAFLWTLPVDRRRLALARVFAGWVWLVAALASLVIWQVVLAAFSRVENPETVPLFVFPAGTALYVFGSALVVGLRHPLRVLFGFAGLAYIVAMAQETFVRIDELLAAGVYPAVREADSYWAGLPLFAQWAAAAFLWTGAGLIALWFAVSRHRENRRH